jgi:hypothetical protein
MDCQLLDRIRVAMDQSVEEFLHTALQIDDRSVTMAARAEALTHAA